MNGIQKRRKRPRRSDRNNDQQHRFSARLHRQRASDKRRQGRRLQADFRASWERLRAGPPQQTRKQDRRLGV